MHEWLLMLGLPGWIVEELAQCMWCDCGGRPAAVGLFRQRHGGLNAMWLCGDCAAEVDEGVRVHWVEGIARRALDEDRA